MEIINVIHFYRNCFFRLSLLLIVASAISCNTQGRIYYNNQNQDSSYITIVETLYKSKISPSQYIKVVGQVFDDFGEQLINVSIYSEGALFGTMSDFHGYFELSLPLDTDLNTNFIIEYVGYKSLKIKLKKIVNKEIIVDLVEGGMIDIKGPIHFNTKLIDLNN